jgi:penicillin G amidase
MYRIKLCVTLIVLFTLVYIFNTGVGALPPLGKLLDPFTGFWRLAEGNSTNIPHELNIRGLSDKVEVEFDDLLVPHIFARNDHDLYFTQGYVTAKHRLWQMDFQTRLASGRLSEVVGDKALEIDKYYRRIGMVWGAERKLAHIEKDSVSWRILQAYTDGINAYVDQLSARDHPLEFKILDYQPEPWTPLKTVLTLMLMAYDLTAHTNDFYLSNIAKEYGDEVVEELFPDYPYYAEPIIPVGTSYNFKTIPVQPHPESLKIIARDLNHQFQPDRDNGSNNWAVSASKSATGFPILANDPHLQLNLPSIWYQAHLNAPSVNVNGVTLPGAPNVIIGYNDNIAWGITNVGADVLDWYQVTFKDSTKEAYLYNNIWMPTQHRVEVIKIKGKASITDTVIYTHYGPIVYLSGQKPFNKAVPPGYAIKWVAHEESDDSKAFVMLNRATGYSDYEKALKHFTVPSSNVVYADRHKDIALWVNGRFPLKFKGQGKFVMDGANPRFEWQGYIPHEQVPAVKNPERGFVSSANQVPADDTYPYYLGWNFASYERGRRINDRLSLMQHVTTDSMRSVQNDNLNMGAKAVLPVMLANVKTDNLSETQIKYLQALKSWDYMYSKESHQATLFDVWWNVLTRSIWNKHFAKEGMMLPNRDVTMHLILNKPTSRWFDDTSTEHKETLADHVHKAYTAAVDSLVQIQGSEKKALAWGKYKGTSIQHIARIPGLGIDKILMGGGRNIVNATSDRHGPSWRMVIETGPVMRGMGVYPGGQSGNPGSYYYDNQVASWKEGELLPLFFTDGPGKGDRSRIKHVMKLQPVNN